MEKWISWLVLKSIPGIGNYIFKRLLDHFHSPEVILSTSICELCRIKGVSQRLASRITASHPFDWAKQEIDCVLQKNYRIVTLTDPEYPKLLLEIEDPPPFLYVKGTLHDIESCVAIVGSRNATQYGLDTAKALAGQLVLKGIAVVSGLARGIDTAAHMGAIERGGRTIAVLGSGLEKIYPIQNAELSHRIGENGAVISEFSLNAKPLPHHFPIRNRIISGMSIGTVVVEASQKSGSLITARLAAEQNREVFAVPGSIRSFKSKGTHRLIKQGAKLVETVDDIFEEILSGYHSSKGNRDQSTASTVDSGMDGLTKEEELVFQSLEPYPLHIDDIEAKCALPVGKVAGILIKLELKGAVVQSSGKYYCISPNGSNGQCRVDK